MKLFNKGWKFLYKSGAVLFLLAIMFIGSVSLVSLSQKGKVYYGDRCISSLNQKTIEYLNQEEIIAYDYELKCNTLYLDLSSKDDLTKDEMIAILVRISSYYKSIGYTTDTQVTLKNNNYLILASLIEDGSVSLSVSEL